MSANLARSSRISSATQMLQRVGLSRLPSGRPGRMSTSSFWSMRVWTTRTRTPRKFSLSRCQNFPVIL